MNKQKTQITISDNLALIVASVQDKFPIYDTNSAIEYLLARGSGIYLEEIGLSKQDLKDNSISKAEINAGQSTRAKDSIDLIKKLNS
jgi:hypothetical protein